MSHCLVTMHRGLYMTVSRAIDVKVDMDKDQTSEQEIKFLRDWIEKQMRTHLLFSDLGPDSLINSFIHSFIHSCVALQDTTTQTCSYSPVIAKEEGRYIPHTHTAHQLKT